MRTGSTDFAPGPRDAIQADSFHQALTSRDPAAIAIVRIFLYDMPAALPTLLRFSHPKAWDQLGEGDVRRAQLMDPHCGVMDDVVVSVRRGSRAAALDIPQVNCARELAGQSSPTELWIHMHGGPWIARRFQELLTKAGIPEMAAAAGLPFLSGSPLQRECWRRLPEMRTLAGARWVLEKTEQLGRFLQRQAKRAEYDLRGARRALRAVASNRKTAEAYAEPLRIALIGPPNAGKSSLLNALVGRKISITSALPGTTRDWIEAPAELGGFPVVWIDTAGIHDASDALDRLGIAASRRAAAEADVCVAVFDISDLGENQKFWSAEALAAFQPKLILLNKCDRLGSVNSRVNCGTPLVGVPFLRVSAETGSGLSNLESALLAATGRTERDSRRRAPISFAQADCLARIADLDDNCLSHNMLQLISAIHHDS